MRGSEVLRDGVGVLPSVAEFDDLIAFRAGQGTTYTFHPSVIRDLLAEHHADRVEIDRLRARVVELEAAGDVLAVEASWTSLDVRCGPLDDAVSDWRAVRGEGSE